MAWNVVIAGGGFGGFFAARTLERLLPPAAARVTLVNDVNFMLYTPLLPGAGGGTLEPRHVVVPLREELERTDIRLGQVLSADPDRKVLRMRAASGREEELEYDHLIVALGSVARTLPIPGLAEHGIGFKTLPEAIALRNRVIAALEAAETLEDPEQRKAWLSFVFVGGGYTGVEGAAELQDFAADALVRYPRCREQGMRWMIVEAKDRIMSETPPEFSRWCTRELRGRGIEVRTNTTLEEVTETSARLSTGEVVPARMLVWSAGIKGHPVIEQLGLPVGRGGRIPTTKFLNVEGHPGHWAIGDGAAVPDPAKDFKEPCPQTAQHAIRQGRIVARNVAAAIGRGRARPFRYRTLGVFVDLGRREAVAQTVGIKWRGLPAWWLARTYHLANVPGAGRRARLLADWNVGLFFGRDTSELGELGHPSPLAGLQEHSSGGTTDGEVDGADGARAAPPAAVHS